MSQIDIFGNIQYNKPKKTRSEFNQVRDENKNDNRYVFNDVLSIKPNYTCVYAELVSGNRKPQNEMSLMNLEDNRASGLISIKANKRLYDSIDWLLYIAKEKLIHNHKFHSSFLFKLNMITLTLPTEQLHDDNYIKNKMLNGFLTILRQRFELVNYIWKAEKTLKGNLHFHILTDVYINYKDINNIWNKILSTHGYISKYKERMKLYFKDGFRMFTNVNDKRSKQQQLKAYKNGLRTEFSQPTGTTDIHSLRKVNNIKAYVSKYLGKNMDTKKALSYDIEKYKKENKLTTITAEEIDMIENKIYNRLKVNGNIWFISRTLSKLRGAATDITDNVRKELDMINEKFNDKILKFDYCTIIKIPVSMFVKSGLFCLKAIFDKHIEKIRNSINNKSNTYPLAPVHSQ